jgi:hypothetical protein
MYWKIHSALRSIGNTQRKSLNRRQRTGRASLLYAHCGHKQKAGGEGSNRNGYGLPDHTISGLLGHRNGNIASRYLHLADKALIEAADLVANETLRLMRG